MAPIQFQSNLFTLGRACAGPLAIVLHEYKSGIEMLDQDMNRCPRPRPLQSPGCHTSYHFGIGGNCKFHQYVDIANTAWGFGVLPAQLCPIPPCPPDPCESCTGLTVDQYNPDEDGNPPILPPFVIGPDGTVNCGVIHVAVNSIWPPSLAGLCCDPNPDAYDCLVRSLCDIYRLSGLLPSQTTLLVHCGELPCLDIDQLVLDILACVNAPPPVELPCNCTPTTEQFCTSLATVPVGTPAIYGTTLVLGADCQKHLLPLADITITTTDTSCLDLTVVEAPTNTFTISGVPVISPTIGNNITCSPNGLFVPTPPDIAINAVDTSCLDLTVTEDPANTFIITGSPVISPAVGNQLSCTLTGLFVPPAVIPPESPITVVDTQTVNLTSSGINNHTVQADVIVSPDAGNQLVSQLNGLFVSPVSSQPVTIDTFTELNTSISTDDGNVLRYIGTIPTTVTLNSGVSNYIWIKNSSTSILTIDPAVGTIDGVAVITLQGIIPAGYSFGNNGGESVHLVFDGTNWFVI